jgi:flagellin-specific chaperone FliS
MTQLFSHFKEKGLLVYEVDDAITFVNHLEKVIKDIKHDKDDRCKKMNVLASKVDEEDMEYFLEDLERVDKGIHHIMELSGFLLNNMGEQISGHIAKTLLPLYASVLLNINDKKDYELIDSVCFICDCMEHGGKALFD